MSRPDFVNDLPDGSTEELYFRVHPMYGGALSWTRKVVGSDGRTHEVWHEVADAVGRVIQADSKLVRNRGQS